MPTVLLVDDDPAFRALARRMLTAAGLSVVAEADSVAAARDAALELRPDAALVDVGLPDGDGVALARVLTELPWRPRVLLTSTDADAATPSDVRRSGAHGFVPKAELPNASLEHLLADGRGPDLVG
jgi:DNA-binding NarL/FixJ family response regulator